MSDYDTEKIVITPEFVSIEDTAGHCVTIPRVVFIRLYETLIAL